MDQRRVDEILKVIQNVFCILWISCLPVGQQYIASGDAAEFPVRLLHCFRCHFL